jgi:hypothetical protein
VNFTASSHHLTWQWLPVVDHEERIRVALRSPSGAMRELHRQIHTECGREPWVGAHTTAGMITTIRGGCGRLPPKETRSVSSGAHGERRWQL